MDRIEKIAKNTHARLVIQRDPEGFKSLTNSRHISTERPSLRLLANPLSRSFGPNPGIETLLRWYTIHYGFTKPSSIQAILLDSVGSHVARRQAGDSGHPAFGIVDSRLPAEEMTVEEIEESYGPFPHEAIPKC